MFRTPVEIEPLPQRISLHDSLLLVGSCFAQAIGKRFQQNKFRACINPFGTLYNPLSVFELLLNAANQSVPDDDTYLVNQNTHFNYHFHSDFSSETKVDLQTQIEQALVSTRNYLKQCSWVVITLGSAFSYRRKETGQVVANCHKMPARLFRRWLLEPGEMITQFKQLYRVLNTLNPNIKYILTVSPVRHLRDTLVQNSVSKSVLRLVAHTIQENYPEDVYYFPSYELLIDELRDYRFYQADMLHPSEVAEDYIWQKVAEHYLDAEAQQFLKTWNPIYRAVQHRAFRPASEAHQQFLRKTIEQLKQLKQQVDVIAEIQELEQQLL
ncbi:GSCFA domain-containing protein [Tunicatimonas pelagia]|uniref:GSCFA domain-containing protein n=1 Tax=Tunicatimonas pelagia TaxID=931531 RepID=UPI002665AEC2|nr:GSCFA domain-containing protein [Tunicatimonas pelagia]WKN45357.1 GSCFA domain-containing protein [Tunicatimonas pelagia]